MEHANLYTVSNIADTLHEPPQRVAYVIRKYRLKPVSRVGIIRLFSEEQAKAIEQELFNIQIRRPK
jgi:hypothetical protein